MAWTPSDAAKGPRPLQFVPEDLRTMEMCSHVSERELEADLLAIDVNAVLFSLAVGVLDAVFTDDAAQARLFGDPGVVTTYLIEQQSTGKFAKGTLFQNLSCVVKGACLRYQRKHYGRSGSGSTIADTAGEGNQGLREVTLLPATRKLADLPQKLRTWGLPWFLEADHALLREVQLRKASTRMSEATLATRMACLAAPKATKRRGMSFKARKAVQNQSYRKNKATSVAVLIALLLQLEAPAERAARAAAKCLPTAGPSGGGSRKRQRVAVAADTGSDSDDGTNYTGE